MTTRLMSGARPTGGLHIGQYFAAFKPFVDGQYGYDEAFFIVSDLHMLTTKFTRDGTDGLAGAARRLMAETIGFGIDPERTTFYLQSSVPWQARIYVLLQSLALTSDLERHGSFAEMARHSSHIRTPTLGLLGYPVLESSDVLSVGATHVTVGQNNRSHFEQLALILDELRRGWGMNLDVPEVIIGRANLVGTDGSDKMSKSLGNAFSFADSPDTVAAKVRGMAVSGRGVTVPVEYLRVLDTPAETCAELTAEIARAGALTDRVVKELTERLVALIEPVDRRARELLADPGGLDDLLRRGGAVADELGREAYNRLAAGLGLLRL
jgi:tryptophanyl-tRNA synthetase